ncbi:MAG: 1-deoxy-D-xylulose-5-phosphate reductoisomerase [Eubacterium sp.]|nr:1-deoxy-D-xylulose-5-phosphate reductoisomerase [Eubacterium sp.]
MKKISIIGSTGSIGTQTLEVVRNNKDIEVAALAAGRKIDILEQQVREFRPRIVSISDERLLADLKARLSDMSDYSPEFYYGMEGLKAAATCEEADIVVTAIVGMIGVEPTLAAIEAGKDIALANKETLVTAGSIVMKKAAEMGIKILPVDSEHSAIFQSLQGNSMNPVKRILLTASGGPFRGKKREELLNVTVKEALNHPNWSMGPKITVDSATMVNKGLEVIEAKWLFNVEPSQIEVVIQPQSIIHSAVEYADGAVIAQLGTPDMKLPIQYALYYPERRFLLGDRLDFTKISGIIIDTPDRETFKGLDFAYNSLEVGGTMPAVFNAANEFAVAEFLAGKISFLGIYDRIEYAMAHAEIKQNPTVSDIVEVMPYVTEMLKTEFSE